MKWIVDKFFLGNFRYAAGVIILVIILMWTWGYVSTLNSDAYAFGDRYVREEPKILVTFGPIKSTRLGFMNFKRSYSAGVWVAKFQIVVTGEKKTGTVSLALKSSESGWLVEDSNVAVE